VKLTVTTDRKPNPSMVELARELAEELSADYVPRRHASVESIKRQLNQPVLVVRRDLTLTLYTMLGRRLFFHPGLFKIRLLNYLKTGRDNLILALNIEEGDLVLDCNLGLAQDALLIAFVTKRPVTGLEKHPVIYEIVKRGIRRYHPEGKLKVAEFAFRLVKPLKADNAEFLRKLKDKSYDVVYFSPMFVNPKKHCSVMAPFREVAEKDFITEETLREAERVARKRVAVKINKSALKLFPCKGYNTVLSSGEVAYKVKLVR